MNNILNHTEFNTYKNIGKKYDEDKVEQCITQAHIELRGVMGDAFYFDVIKNQEQYTDLLKGCEFSIGEFTYSHDGLKSLVADYSYSRYLYEVNTILTPFGMVSKNSNDSTQVDRNMIKDMTKQISVDAGLKWQLIEAYLNNNPELFPVWAKQKDNKGDLSPSNSSFNQVRFTFLSTGRD